jgi:hypothetical protein
MHLHARRIRIDHPDGMQIDVRAELPPHFAESLEQLAFDIELADMLLLDEPKFKDTDAGKKRLIANKAKSARKERKGERRGRGDAAKATSKSAARAAPKTRAATKPKAAPKAKSKAVSKPKSVPKAEAKPKSGR